MTTTRAIGVDIGGTNLRAALVEIGRDGARIVEQGRRKVGEERAPTAVAEALADAVRALDPDGTTPVGLGIAAMLRGDVVANAPNLGWKDVPFVELAAAALGRRIWMENDLAAICWGEHRFGAARGYPSVICVFLGTGVGGGAVLDGRLYRGASGAAAEIGHVKMAPDGRLCGCGQRGCLEAYAGGRQLALMARESPSELLLSQASGDASSLHAGHLDAAARAGDAGARAIVERAARYLGHALADSVTLVNPSCLLLGGTVWDGCELLRKLCLERFHALANAPAHEAVSVVDAMLDDDAGALGAADLARIELGFVQK